jgi:type III secretion protein I
MEIAALSAALTPALTTPAAPPAQLAMERFNAVMNAPEAGAPALASLQSAMPSMAAAPLDGGPQTLGNQILASLRSTTAEYSEKWQSISGRLDAMGTQPSVADMMRLQAELLQVSVHYEIVGKAVSRTTQNIDTLVRMS